MKATIKEDRLGKNGDTDNTLDLQQIQISPVDKVFNVKTPKTTRDNRKKKEI